MYTRTDRFFYVYVCVCMHSVMIDKIFKTKRRDRSSDRASERKRKINEINVKKLIIDKLICVVIRLCVFYMSMLTNDNDDDQNISKRNKNKKKNLT